MTYLPATAIELMHAMDRRLRAIENHLAALRAGIASGADSALVAAVYAVAGERPFTARELLQMVAMQGVPEQALRVLIAGRSPKGVGKMLKAAAGRPCDSGLMLTFEPDRSPNIWRVTNPRKPAIY